MSLFSRRRPAAIANRTPKNLKGLRLVTCEDGVTRIEPQASVCSLTKPRRRFLFI